METLNLDCIEHIMTFLPLRDKMYFALASSQALEAFRLWSKCHKIVDKKLLGNLSLKEIKTLIRLVGDVMEYFYMRKDLLPEISKYCTNLRHITVERHHDQKFEQQIPLLARLKSLVSVSYETVCTGNSYLEDLVKALKELPKLRSLCLFCEYYKGKYLSELNQIENLALYECRNIEFIHFEAFCLNMKSLQNLYLHGQYEGNYRMPASMYKAMAQHGKNLENLWLSHIVGPYELVADLPKLKRLSIATEDIALRPKLFTDLAAKKAKQLNCLKLCGATLTDSSSEAIGRIEALQELSCSLENLNSLRNFDNLKNLEYLYLECRNLTDKNALRIIRTLPSLYYFGTGSKNLSESFVFDVIKMLRCKEESSARTYFNIIIGADGPLQNVLSNPLYLDARDVIQILGVFAGLSKCTTMDETYYENMYFLHHV